MATINIHLKNGAISCTPNDGHVRARHGSVLEWVSAGEEFTLSFQLLGGGSAWPFQGPAPQQPTRHFKAALLPLGADTAEAPAYKYSVTVGGKVLDPIVIVDK
jgi:hypothetical protein